MLRLNKHPEGPNLARKAKKRTFKNYGDLARWAERHLPHGRYCVADENPVWSSPTREVEHRAGIFRIGPATKLSRALP